MSAPIILFVPVVGWGGAYLGVLGDLRRLDFYSRKCPYSGEKSCYKQNSQKIFTIWNCKL